MSEQTSASTRSISRPISIFENACFASQKWIRRNLNSSSCGPNVTSLKNTTRSLLLEGTSEQTTALPLRFVEEESPETPDWPIGFIDAAEGIVGATEGIVGAAEIFIAAAEGFIDAAEGLTGAAEETASFPLGFLEIRSPDAEFLLLEFIGREDSFAGNQTGGMIGVIKEIRVRDAKGIH